MRNSFLQLRGVIFVLVMGCAASVAQNQTVLDSKAIFERTKAATVVVLTGEGVGRLTAMASGVMISRDGVLLTAWHAIKGASEVQIRLDNGEVFDHVELLGVDERRDVAAIRISAGALPSLTIGSTTNLAQGDSVYAVTNGGGLTWSASEGILSSLRTADELPNGESGYRLLQFSAPVAFGASGGPLVDRAGNLIGVITKGNGSSGFAVPVESVVGLAQAGQHTTLGSGHLLQLPAKMARRAAESSADIGNFDHQKILNEARTIRIASNTAFVTRDTLSRSLALQKDWAHLKLTVVADQRVGDITLSVDRVIFTHVHTYSLVDTKTSIILASGRVRAFDGILASDGIAKEVVKYISEGRTTKVAKQDQ